MAVAKRAKKAAPIDVTPIRDFWPKYKRRNIILTILMQATVTLVIGLALLVSGITEPSLMFAITLTAVLATTIGLNLVLLLSVTSQPLKDISDALTHVSGEPTIVTPPNPNARHFERDGLKPILQLIYKLSVEQSQEKGAESTPAVDLATALDNSKLGFIVLDKDRRVTYANRKAPTHTDANGETVIDLVFEDSDTLSNWLAECDERTVHSDKTWQRIPNKIIGQSDRKIYDISASYQKGSQAEVVISLFDRSELYQPEDDELDFIAFAAHELRGPITVIRGYLDVLDDELGHTFDADQAELLSRLTVSANRLGGYVNNILNASRYDRRHLQVHVREDTLATVYDTIRDDMQLRASSQNRLLAVAIPPELPTIAVDRASAGEVLSNLIDNAIKYSHEGGVINVSAEVEGDFVKISIEDHGIGMPASVISNLFHKFYRSHRSRETVAGTGIGLYISKAIVESHGGTMGVRSTEGEGSIFTFTLPIYATVAEKLKANGNKNDSLISHDTTGWIKNHSMFRG